MKHRQHGADHSFRGASRFSSSEGNLPFKNGPRKAFRIPRSTAVRPTAKPGNEEFSHLMCCPMNTTFLRHLPTSQAERECHRHCSAHVPFLFRLLWLYSALRRGVNKPCSTSKVTRQKPLCGRERPRFALAVLQAKTPPGCWGRSRPRVPCTQGISGFLLRLALTRPWYRILTNSWYQETTIVIADSGCERRTKDSCRF